MGRLTWTSVSWRYGSTFRASRITHKRICTESTRVLARGHVPITVAATIASSDDAEIQEARRKAYEKSDLRGKQLLRARKLIEERQVQTCGERNARRLSDKLVACLTYDKREGD